jgi:hypothetical protein
MRKSVSIATDCVVISKENEEILNDLFAELFVEFVNTQHGSQVIERKL